MTTTNADFPPKFMLWRPGWDLQKAKDWYTENFERYQTNFQHYKEREGLHRTKARAWEVSFLTWAWKNKNSEKTTAIIWDPNLTLVLPRISYNRVRCSNCDRRYEGLYSNY